jgi:GDP/UDP-N,N'-diacetylbacillosamine 2-epimerase (hydrolysing)
MKICTVTGSRAEFYILKNLIRKLEKNKYFNQHLIVTGSHNLKTFGNTIKEINKEKIKIGSRVIIKLKNDSETGISQSFGEGVKLFSKAFLKIKPDILLILGDRYEIFAAAIAACLNRIPIAHIHGGERTEGAIDEAIRHSITKLSHMHFVSTNEYFRRVEQLGENRRNIFNVGSMGVESLKRIELLSQNELEKKLKIEFSKKNLLITFHPESLKSKNENKKKLTELLNSLKHLPDTTLIFTMPGADANFKMIVKEINQFIKKNKKSYFFKSLGDKLYFSLCKVVDLMIGNSSSGVIEMPSFKKGTINIGERQKGRIKAKSVLNVDFNEKKIRDKIRYSYSKKFNIFLRAVKNPYDQGKSSEKIIKILKTKDLNNILNKRFIDYKKK